MVDAGSLTAAQRSLHALSRLGFGPRPGDVAAVQRLGVDRYIARQLDPESIPEPADLTRRIASLRTLRMSPVELFIEFREPLRHAAKGDRDARKQARRDALRVIMEATEGRIVRAAYGPRQLHEVMVAFWFNHFNVFAGKGLCSIWTGAFEQEAIRPHTMGRFRDLLGATAKHPAMLFYLDNWQNTAPNAPGTHGRFDGINENYAREVMELHTLGVNGGYTQTDVISLAHILTGWGLLKRGTLRNQMRAPRNSTESNFEPRPDSARREHFFRRWREHNRGHARRVNGVIGQYGFFFDANRHDFAARHLLGHAFASGGIEQGERALDLLARSPATANHLSYQLAQYFVADNPPPALVRRMANRYLATDGNIREVLATIFASSEFRDPANYGKKFKTPYEYVISAVRAAGAPVVNVLPLAWSMAQLDMPLYRCQTPDGYKNTRAAWLNPDAMMLRLSFATALGAGRLPLEWRPDGDFGSLGGSRKAAPMRPLKSGGKRNLKGRRILNGKMAPPDPAQLAATLGDSFSARTADAVESAPQRLRAPLILGSPEFMVR